MLKAMTRSMTAKGGSGGGGGGASHQARLLQRENSLSSLKEESHNGCPQSSRPFKKE
jgi:hypothetical protein